MKRLGLILLTFLGCSVLIVLLTLTVALGDKTMLERVIDDSYVIQVRAEGYWEICIPVYLKIRKDGKTLRSATVDCYHSESIESDVRDLEIRKIDNIIFVYDKEIPNKILAMVNFEDGLIFPYIRKGNYEELKLYNSRIRDLFARLKMLLKNENLELSRYPWVSHQE